MMSKVETKNVKFIEKNNSLMRFFETQKRLVNDKNFFLEFCALGDSNPNSSSNGTTYVECHLFYKDKGQMTEITQFQNDCVNSVSMKKLYNIFKNTKIFESARNAKCFSDEYFLDEDAYEKGMIKLVEEQTCYDFIFFASTAMQNKAIITAIATASGKDIQDYLRNDPSRVNAAQSSQQQAQPQQNRQLRQYVSSYATKRFQAFTRKDHLGKSIVEEIKKKLRALSKQEVLYTVFCIDVPLNFLISDIQAILGRNSSPEDEVSLNGFAIASKQVNNWTIQAVNPDKEALIVRDIKNLLNVAIDLNYSSKNFRSGREYRFYAIPGSRSSMRFIAQEIAKSNDLIKMFPDKHYGWGTAINNTIANAFSQNTGANWIGK